MGKGRGIEYEVKTRRIRCGTIVARAGKNLFCGLLRTLAEAEQQHGFCRTMIGRQDSQMQQCARSSQGG